MTPNPMRAIADMSFEEWLFKDGRFHFQDDAEMDRSAAATEVVDARLSKAVAYYLYIESKGVSDDKAGLYRAAALALIGKPVDAALLREAEKRRSDDDPLYSRDVWVKPALQDLWHYHHRREIDAVEQAYSASHPEY